MLGLCLAVLNTVLFCRSVFAAAGADEWGAADSSAAPSGCWDIDGIAECAFGASGVGDHRPGQFAAASGVCHVAHETVKDLVCIGTEGVMASS